MRDLTLKQRRAIRLSGQAELIENCEKRIAAGDKTAILEAVGWCAQFGIPIPIQTARAFLAAVRKVRNFEHDSWDAVFGKPHPAGLKLQAHKKEHDLRYKVYWRVLILRSEKPKPKDIYGTAGKECGISGATAKRYFEAENRLVKKSQRLWAKTLRLSRETVQKI